MKNQYFGDINDFFKYLLLRTLSEDLKIGLCWMLTPDDRSKDGKHVSYFKRRPTLRHRDIELFDWLERCLHNSRPRAVSLMQDHKILPNVSFFTELLFDGVQKREAYFTAMFDQFNAMDLIFFDADNGLAPRSCRPGKKGSSKYLFASEAAIAFSRGHSLLIYQHFARQERSLFVKETASKILDSTGAKEIYSIRSPHVVFLLVPHAQHSKPIRRRILKIQDDWKGELITSRHFTP
jgi:hypothetical protein